MCDGEGLCVGKRAVKAGSPFPGEPPVAGVAQEQSVVTFPSMGVVGPPAEQAH